MTYYRLQLHNGALPAIGGTAALHDASVEELRVLLSVIERGSVASDVVADLARAAGASVPRTRAALRYWLECGILEESEESAPIETATAETTPTPVVGEGSPLPHAPAGATPAFPSGSRSDAILAFPSGSQSDASVVNDTTGGVRARAMTEPQRERGTAAAVDEVFPTAPEKAKKPLRPAQETEELPAHAVAKTVKDAGLAAFIDTAEQTVGRVFNLRELNILTGLLETTPFSQEYLLTLISYCKTKTKRFSFGYLEKTAFSMLERECLTVEELSDYLVLVERVTSEEYKLRRLFGFGERRLSPREREYFERWVGKYGYTVDVIGIAYDIAVNNTGKVALAYMDKLITRFYENGCRDVAAVEALLERERAEAAAKPASRHTGAPKKGRDTTFHTGLTQGGSATDGSSFVASDFLSAALRRSYGDDGEGEE